MKKYGILIGLVFFLDACSVYMASKKEGVDIDQVANCRTRACVQSKGAKLVDAKKNSKGQLVEIYKVQKPKGSTTRAVMHGVLDVATIGLWELAGTPIEGYKNQDEYLAIRVVSNQGSDNIEKMELLQ